MPFQGGLPDFVTTGSLNYLQRAGKTVYGVFTPLERDILLNLKKEVVLYPSSDNGGRAFYSQNRGLLSGFLRANPLSSFLRNLLAFFD